MKKSTKFLSAALLFLGFGAFAQAPVVDFSWTPTSPCAGTSIQITGSVTSGTVTTWGYSLTGATAASTLVQNPVVTFTAAGVQTITLVGLNGITPSQQVVKTITVQGISVTTSTNPVCAGQSATLTGWWGTSYSWQPGGQTTSSIVVTPTANATYTAMNVTCSVQTVFTQSVTVCAGLQTFAMQNAFGMYPNPATSDVTLDFGNNFNKNIQVMDLTGKVVISVATLENKVKLDMSNLNSGVYFVRISSNNKVEVAKLVKN